MKSNQSFLRPLLFILAIIFALSGGVFSISPSHRAHAQDDDRPIAYGIHWSPDGKWIAVPSSDGVWIYDTELIERAPVQYFAGSVIPAIAFDPIRDRLAVYDEATLSIHILEPATGEIITDVDARIDDFTTAYDLAYSDDGKLLTVGFYVFIKIYDAITYHEYATYYSDDTSALASSNKPRSMMVGSYTGSIRLFDLNVTDAALIDFLSDNLTLYETVFTLRMLPDSAEGIALRGTGLIQFNLDDETTRLLDPAFEEWVRGFEMNHAADTLAISQDGQLSFYDLPSATITQQITTPNAEDQVIFGIAFSPDDTRMVTLETTGNIQIWDVAEGRVIVTWKDNFNRAYSQKWG